MSERTHRFPVSLVSPEGATLRMVECPMRLQAPDHELKKLRSAVTLEPLR